MSGLSGQELPGMWEAADFEGGLDEVRGGGLREVLVICLRGNGGYRGAGELADDVLRALALPEHRDEVRALIGDERVGVPQRWVDEVVLALDAATTIGQRSCRTGDHLHYANHDRLLREAAERGYSVYAPREGPTPEWCPAGICRRPAGHEGPHRECPFYVGQREEP